MVQTIIHAPVLVIINIYQNIHFITVMDVKVFVIM
ncbi:unnamed protein product [Trichobilharzia regenti]|nr:unnamed protein product [Trichobilharzia regenti]